MLTEEVIRLYKRFRLLNYREMFGRIREKDGSLSATEAFAADVIYLMEKPTITQLAETLGISQPNATYKVNQLIQKGYVEKIPSLEDRRETHLQVTDRYIRYSDRGSENLIRALETLKTQFTTQEMETFSRVIRALSDAIDQDNA